MALITRIVFHPATTHIAAALAGAVTLKVGQIFTEGFKDGWNEAALEEMNKKEKAA
jgi:hypothetical protein